MKRIGEFYQIERWLQARRLLPMSLLLLCCRCCQGPGTVALAVAARRCRCQKLSPVRQRQRQRQLLPSALWLPPLPPATTTTRSAVGVVRSLCTMAAAPTRPENDERDSLAHAHLNDPNFDVDAELRRRANDAHLQPPQSTAPSSRPSVRRTLHPGPPHLSPPASSSHQRPGFPLIPQCPPSPSPLPTQPPSHVSPHDPHPCPLDNPTPSSQPAPWSPPLSVPVPSFFSDPKPAFNRPGSAHSHTTSLEDECDMESIAPSTSSRRCSGDTYRYDKKSGGSDDAVATQLDSRSEVDFEEYVSSFPSFSKPYSKRSSTLDRHPSSSFTSSSSSRSPGITHSHLVRSDLEDDSPYPEVRAAVANTDDPSMPTNTFRMFVPSSPSISTPSQTLIPNHTGGSWGCYLPF
jgi:hypothetical protein